MYDQLRQPHGNPQAPHRQGNNAALGRGDYNKANATLDTFSMPTNNKPATTLIAPKHDQQDTIPIRVWLMS